MPSRKQRRRRQKDRRHEYEFVYVDEEGHELDVEDVPQPSRNGTSAKAPKKAAARGGGRGSRRVVEPPSWRKAARRAGIFAPFMFAILYFLNRSRDVPIYGVVFNTLILLAFFIPFGYLMDRLMYRTYLRRTGGEPKKRA